MKIHTTFEQIEESLNRMEKEINEQVKELESELSDFEKEIKLDILRKNKDDRISFLKPKEIYIDEIKIPSISITIEDNKILHLNSLNFKVNLLEFKNPKLISSFFV